MLLEKREEKLKKKERQLEEESERRERAAGELETAKRDCVALSKLNANMKQALEKKEKQLADTNGEMEEMRSIQAAIFNLSKKKSEKA